MQSTGSFVAALVFVSVVAMIGAFSWIFLIGDLKPMRIASVHGTDAP